ncbi:hypothetical protein [Bosea sp. LjRoot237]|uniref:hypothetical protein n=1 Tax=Bosea sp. LjRoot237 TaxID=3342292 RepID=UPI003ECD29C9
MKSYYECHVTMEAPAADNDNRQRVKAAVDAIGWKFSAIEGDIVLGDGVKLYATRHFNTRLGDDRVVSLLHDAADTLAAQSINVVRRKVERVLFDDRSAKVRPCDGGCLECHLDDLKESA